MTFVLLLHFATGLKSLAETLRDILKEWGIDVNMDNSPNTWTGVTCADKSDDIVKLNLDQCNLRGNNSI